jgi:hypothetical protein
MEMSARIVSARLADQELAQRLAQRSEQLLARGMNNIEQELQIQSRMAATFRDMDDQIAKANRSVASRADVMNATQALAKQLGVVSQELNAREAEFRSRSTAATSEELAAVQALDSRVAQRAELLQKLAARQAP